MDAATARGAGGAGEAAAAILVSVVVPTHARRALLERLLHSLAAQTLAPERFEVIIVHNHTDDGTEALARAWCAQRPGRAAYHRRNFNGPTRSRELGAREARGEVIAFIDDDCVATPGWLEAGLAAFAQGGDALGLVQGRTLPCPGQPRGFLSKTVCIDAPSVYYETCNIFYRRSAFLAVDGFAKDFLDRWGGEDTDLGWRVTEAGFGAAFAADALVHHEVVSVPLRRWLWEPRYYEVLPLLVRLHPALRERMYRRVFLSKDTCLFHGLVASLLLAPLAGPWAAAAAVPYLLHRYATGGHVGGPAARLLRVAGGIPRGGYMWWALVKGSLQARSLLL